MLLVALVGKASLVELPAELVRQEEDSNPMHREQLAAESALVPVERVVRVSVALAQQERERLDKGLEPVWSVA